VLLLRRGFPGPGSMTLLAYVFSEGQPSLPNFLVSNHNTVLPVKEELSVPLAIYQKHFYFPYSLNQKPDLYQLGLAASGLVMLRDQRP
jgi:hypothetical protein